MTHNEVMQLIGEVQVHLSELDNVEVKLARGGTPQRLFESLSAFANRPDGGVLLLGLDEGHSFDVAGVGDAQKLQQDIANLAAKEMEPVIRPEFTVEQVEGKTVVVVVVDEIEAEQKPCYYKPAGLQKGSYIRVANTNRQMTDYEIFGYLSGRVPPTFDEEVVPDATMNDLDGMRLEEYLAQLRRARPSAAYLQMPFELTLQQLRIVRESDGILRPTLAGLLLFGRNPQKYDPQLVITFLQFYGTIETEKTPRGERFLDNRKFEGAIPVMIEGVVNHVLASMRKSSLIEGLLRRDIPEYPAEAVREAIVNAVAHRDYSQYVRGSHVQIRMFADRLEVQSPGGLYGNVTVETLEQEHSTRNRVLMRLMEDLHLVENRGSGIRTMVAALRDANLEPPQFQDKRSSFWVTFRNHTLMSPEAIRWLNQFAGHRLSDQQRLVLAYLGSHDNITNSDYQRLNRVDSVIAKRELRGLVELDLIQQHDSRRWAYYTLNALPRMYPLKLESDEEKIVAYVREHGSISNRECRGLLSIQSPRAWYILKNLAKRGSLKREGVKRWTRYVLP